MLEKIPAIQADLTYSPCFLDPSEAESCFQQLFRETPWRQDRIRLYGKVMNVPRLQAWYGDEGCGYQYSGINLSPLPWTSLLQELRKRLEQEVQADFNSVLVNLYRDGQDSNGWHADNESELGDRPTIASVSLGEVRRFRLRHRLNRDQPALHFDLPAGSLFVMAGDSQQYWQHCITKTSRQVEPRINLTFRKIILAERTQTNNG